MRACECGISGACGRGMLGAGCRGMQSVGAYGRACSSFILAPESCPCGEIGGDHGEGATGRGARAGPGELVAGCAGVHR